MESSNYFLDAIIIFYRTMRFILSFIVPFILIIINFMLLFVKNKIVEIGMDIVMAIVSTIILADFLQHVDTAYLILSKGYIIIFALITICIIAVVKIKSKSLKNFFLFLKIVIYSICSLYLISQIKIRDLDISMTVLTIMNYALCSIRYVLNMRLAHKEKMKIN